MWTPNRNLKHLPVFGQDRMCHTQVKLTKVVGKIVIEEAKEHTEKISTHDNTELKQVCQEEHKEVSSSLQYRKTVKFTRPKRHPDQLMLECSGSKIMFEVYKDSEIGLKEIEEDIVSTTMDDDVKTTTELLRRAERECMQDLMDAIDIHKDEFIMDDSEASRRDD